MSLLSFEEIDRIFISDVHLGGFDERTNEAVEKNFIRLLQNLSSATCTLYLLGDLFDYWMEFPGKNTIPNEFAAVIESLNTFKEKGNEIVFLPGNHDWWTYGFLESLGWRVYKKGIVETIGRHKILMLHGDGHPDGDHGLHAPLLHRILKNEHFVDIFQKLFSAKRGLKIMKYFSGSVKRRSPQKAKRLNHWAEKTLQKNDLDFILAGHDHIPRVETFSCGSYINLGTFCMHKTLAVNTKSGLELVVWDADSLALNAFNNTD